MGGFDGDDMAAQDAGQPKVADDVERLVTDEFVRIAQCVQPAFVVVDDDGLERPAEAETRFPERFDFAFISDGPCGKRPA